MEENQLTLALLTEVWGVDLEKKTRGFSFKIEYTKLPPDFPLQKLPDTNKNQLK